MNDCSISSQHYMCIRRVDVTFTKLLVSSLDSIYLEYNTRISYELSTDTSFEIEIIWKTVVSVLNYIFKSV
jgi:hypothetical protein